MTNRLPRVLNKIVVGTPLNSVYGGRPAWPVGLGNPYVIGIDGTRKDVIAKHKEDFLSNSKWIREVKKHKGKDWVCWCAPKPCHCDIYLEVANEER